MSSRSVEIAGLLGAWACIVAVRVIDGARSGDKDSMSGLLTLLEVLSWFCLAAVILAFSRRVGNRWFDSALAAVWVLTAAFVVLVGAGVLAMVSSDGGADNGGANIGLGVGYLVGLGLFAVGTVLVARQGIAGQGTTGQGGAGQEPRPPLSER